ncbi:MAG: hypothetical protein SPJ45_00680 [Anaerovoracaceae bacterium]|nr:hypothetical protein [Bacillota bacterium]MDY5905383.1 hypothetical protein [Anaerovoracaceae bacterium]
MKKGSVIFAVAFAMICVSVFGIFEFVNADNTSSEKLAESTGKNLRKGAEMLLDGGVSTQTVDNGKIGESQKMIMNINGIDISEGFYKYKLGLMSSIGYENPEAATIDLIKKYAVQWKFAEENGILPSEAEVLAEVKANRDPIYENSDAYDSMVAFLDGTGITESEYWDIIQTKYEAPYALVGVKVSDYCKKNNLDEPEWKDADVKFYE